jgi:hypothetical protein
MKGMQIIAGPSVSHHERHEAAIPAARPLLLITWPHDLHTADGTKATKLTRQVGLIHLQHNTPPPMRCHQVFGTRLDRWTNLLSQQHRATAVMNMHVPHVWMVHAGATCRMDVTVTL